MIYSSESSLMKKFNLEIYQLDYKYIEKCSNVKILEKILRVLRSGEEGIFPHLISFCEKKLLSIDPKNRLLQTEERIRKYNDLPQEERKTIQNDMEKWSENNSYCKEGNCKDDFSGLVADLPPVRKQEIFKKSTFEKKSSNESCNVKSKKLTPRSYKEWDKFNVDDELEKLDNEEATNVKNGMLKSKISQLSDKVSITGFTEKDREYVANLENTKGNEAFKAKEYEEAAIYYTRSLSAHRMTKTLNNRAQAYIKLKNYAAAVMDCNEVIILEPDNLKAYYRRGLAHKEAGMYDLATMDFQIVLELDSECKAAVEHLQQIPVLLKEKKKENSKILIEELESTMVEKEPTLSKNVSKIPEHDISTKIKIEEVDEENSRPLLDDMCNFSHDQTLSKKTKEMLMIFNNNRNNQSCSKNDRNLNNFCHKQHEIKQNRNQKKIFSDTKRIFAKESTLPITNRYMAAEGNNTITDTSKAKQNSVEGATSFLRQQNEVNQKEENNNGIDVKGITIREETSIHKRHNAWNKKEENCKINASNDREKIIFDENITYPKDNSTSNQKEPESLTDKSSVMEENKDQILDRHDLQKKLMSLNNEYLYTSNSSKPNDPLTNICNQIIHNKNENDKFTKINNSENCKQNLENSKDNSCVTCIDKEETKQMESKSLSVTPFEFVNLWRFKNANSNGEIAAEILQSIEPNELPKILTNKLDGPLLNGIFMAIGYLITNKQHVGIEHLNYLVQTPRVDMIAMFLTDKEKKDIGHLFSTIEQVYGHNLTQVREILNIT